MQFCYRFQVFEILDLFRLRTGCGKETGDYKITVTNPDTVFI